MHMWENPDVAMGTISSACLLLSLCSVCPAEPEGGRISAGRAAKAYECSGTPRGLSLISIACSVNDFNSRSMSCRCLLPFPWFPFLSVFFCRPHESVALVRSNALFFPPFGSFQFCCPSFNSLRPALPHRLLAPPHPPRRVSVGYTWSLFLSALESIVPLINNFI